MTGRHDEQSHHVVTALCASVTADGCEWGSQSSIITAYTGGEEPSFLAPPPEELDPY